MLVTFSPAGGGRRRVDLTDRRQRLMYVIATMLQLPFHLMVASPWLIGAAGVGFLTRRWQGRLWRLLVLSLIVAIGVAPAYGVHLAMVPMYALVISGTADPLSATVFVLMTWPVIALIFAAIRRARPANGSSPFDLSWKRGPALRSAGRARNVASQPRR